MSWILRFSWTAFVVTAPAAPVWAQTPTPRVWLAPLGAEAGPGAGMISEKFDEAARSELRKQRHVELRGDPASVGAASTSGQDVRVDQAENLRTAAKAAFAKKDFETALTQLRGALVLYEEAIASVNKLEAVLETLGYLGACSLALGYDDEAKDYFQRVLAIMPDAAPLDEYPAETAAVFEKLKLQQAKKKKGSVVIKTVPSGAEIRVDGVDKGLSPATVTGLSRGEHYIQATHAEAGLGGLKVEIKGAKPETVELTLSTTIGPAPAKPVDPALIREVAALVAQGKFGSPFREKATEVAALTLARCLVVGNVQPQGNGFVLDAYVYDVDQKQTAALDQVRFRADLSSVAVQAAGFARTVEGACGKFPFDKIIVGGVVARAAPAPVVTPPLVVEPEPAPVVVAKPKAQRVRLPPAQTLDDDGLSLEEDDGEPWHKAWWLWAAAGAVVIGGTATAGYLLLQDGAQRDTVDGKVTW